MNIESQYKNLTKVCFGFIILLLPLKGLGQNINVQETYISPKMMNSSDGRGGTTSTYFHIYKNQVEKINKNSGLYEVYTILEKKNVGSNTYYTLKGNNRGVIVYMSFRAAKNNKGTTYRLVFEVPGEFKEEYYAF